MAIPAKNVLGNPNVTEGNFQVAIEQLRESVIGSGKDYDSANTYMQYDTCVYGGVTYYSKINSNTGNTPSIGANWGDIADLISSVVHKTGDETIAGVKTFSNDTIMNGNVTLSGTGGFYIGTGTTANKVAIKQSIGNSIGGIAITASNNSSTCIISEIDDGSLIFRNNAIDTLKVFNGNTLHISQYGGLGYGTGSGGTVTQLTSKSTAVTLNKPCGQIIMNNAALASGAQTNFNLNNSLITINDIVVVQITHSNGFAYSVWVGYLTAGIATITVKNMSASSLSDALIINYAIIKGAIV